MKPLSTKQILVILLAIIIVGVGLFLIINQQKDSSSDTTDPVQSDRETTLERKVIGTSVEGRDIEAYTYLSKAENRDINDRAPLPKIESGSHLVFIGGIHGGYEWNSVILAYSFIDYLNDNLEIIPEGLSVTIIPSANPDGVYEVVNKEGRFDILDIPSDREATVPGRFNGNDVDLNRNFDCRWKQESTWRGNTVSAGTEPFSEPEARAIRDFVLDNNPSAVVFWHSQANAVYGSECGDVILPVTFEIMNLYASAANYNAVEIFDAYEINGDAEGWLASIGIPAITVELETHETIEWERNLSGVTALFEYFHQNYVKQYIGNNISFLSPEPEVLGGTFYVTNIEFTNNSSGVVMYEDGHIALVADFTYSFDEEGDLEVVFTNVREPSL